MCRILMIACLILLYQSASAAEPIDVWPNLAPGETARNAGETMPARENETPTITRVINVTRPTMTVHQPAKPNGTAVVILPGGGFGRVVPDLEGTEAADWLNRHGVTAFVLSYRTTADTKTPGWIKPLQDAQRAVALVRAESAKWGIEKERVGILGFSAGGQVAGRLLSGGDAKTYARIDDVDAVSHRPDFALLVYPWNMYDAKLDSLVEGIQVPKTCPPTYIVHTDDDRSSSLGAALFYAGLKKHGIPAELHVYGNGGHGYGLRPVKGSQISTWPEHAAHWLGTRGLLK
ncbi:alpha/beta hydrolase [Anatilimnocola sp. NA78]|uniref:alpha/beta hydrolase n=1 Tax=Anatilimnocola sp. NA78 TaxID=3415683 RepID=UPI003CE46D03